VAAVHPAIAAAHVAVVGLIHSMEISLPIVVLVAWVLAISVPTIRVIIAIAMIAPARISAVIITIAGSAIAMIIGDG